MALTKLRAHQLFDIDYKQAVRVLTDSNVSLSGGAPLTVDGVSLTSDDRVLVAGQTTASQNGLYQVVTPGSGSNGTWIRSQDADTTGELLSGAIVMVAEGDVYADTQWKLVTDNPITIGSTALTWEQNSAFAFGNIYANGIAVLASTVGDTVNIDAGDNITISANATSKTVTIGVTGISLNSISNGTSNVNVVSSGGNITVGVAGSEVAKFSSTGLDVTGAITASTTINATGNITGGNLSTAGSIDAASLDLTNTLNVDGLSTFQSNVSIAGNLSVTGNITYINVSDLVVEDPLIFLAANNVTDLADIGFTAQWNDGTQQYGGIARDHTDGVWKVFSGVTTAPTTVVDWANAVFDTFRVGALRVDGYISGADIDLTGNVTGTTGVFTTGNITTVNATTINGTNAVLSGDIDASTGTIDTLDGVDASFSGNLEVTGTSTFTGNITSGNIDVVKLTNGSMIIASGNISNAGTVAATNVNATDIIASNVTVTTVNATDVNATDVNATDGTFTGNVVATGDIDATGDMGATSILATGTITAIGNIDGGNISTTGLIGSALLNVTANAVVGNITAGAGVFSQDVSGSGSAVFTGNITGGNLITSGGIDATGTIIAVGNITGGNLITSGDIDATGTITAGNYLGNGATLSGINAFSTFVVDGQDNVVADSISDSLTLTAGAGIVLLTDAANDAITIAVVSSGDSIFATGGDMGTVDEEVNATEDLGTVDTGADPVAATYNLEQIVQSGVLYPDQLVLPSYTVAELGSLSATPAGQMVFCTNDAGGSIPAFSDGTDWRRVTDRQVIS